MVCPRAGETQIPSDAKVDVLSIMLYCFYRTSTKPQTQKKKTFFMRSHLCHRELIQETEKKGINLNDSKSGHSAITVIPQDPQLNLPIYKGANLTSTNHYLPPVGCVNYYLWYIHRSSVERDKENYSAMIITALTLEQNTRNRCT